MGMDTNGIVAGVGVGTPKYWELSEEDGLWVFKALNSGVCLTVDGKNPADLEAKAAVVALLVDRGVCSPNELAEFREWVRLYNGLSAGGTGYRTGVGIGEATKVVYQDGVRKEIKVRKKRPATPLQVQAAETAREFAHTPAAEEKRRKSIKARQEDSLLGNL